MRPLVPPIAVSLLFIGWSPVMGEVRDTVRDALGPAFVPVVGATIVVTVLALLAYALRHIRERRGPRYGAMAGALAIFAGYAALMRTGQPEVDAVERIHFIEFGLVAVLFYRAWRPKGLGAAAALTLMAGTLVGIGEEWLQWLVPTRVGDVRDVVLNVVSLGCGTIFAAGLYPPPSLALRLSATEGALLARTAPIVILAFGGFFHSAHLGYEHTDAAIGRFRSFFTIPRLHELAADRRDRWRSSPPAGLEPFALQDHYLIEGGSHVLFRNAYYSAGQYREAWLENSILERYYDPVLDTRSFSTGVVHRWEPAQRDEVERAFATLVAPVGEPWTSIAGTDRVYIRPSKPVFWTMILFAAGGCALVSEILRRRAVSGRPRRTDATSHPAAR